VAAFTLFYLASPDTFEPYFAWSEFITRQFQVLIVGDRFEGLTANPFQLAFSCLVAISFLWIMLIHYFFSRRRVWALLTLVALVGLIAVTYLTATKSAFVALLFILAFGAMEMRYVLRVRWTRVVVLLCGVLSLIAVVFFSLPEQSQELIASRLTKTSGEARLALWSHFVQVSAANPLGVGFNYEQKFAVPADAPGRPDNPPHNFFLTAWMLGGIGAVLSLLLFFLVVLLSLRARLKEIRARSPSTIDIYYIGAVVAFLGLWVNAFFVGVLFADFMHSVLLGMVMAGIPAPTKRRITSTSINCGSLQR
jgi:O-antigen ligase